MIPLTILFGIIALLAGHAAGLTESRIGTAAITAIVLLLAITAMPAAWWLFDSAIGYATTLCLWVSATAFYHSLLTQSTPIMADARRHVPVVELRQPRIIHWQWGRYAVGIAVAKVVPA